MENTTDRILRQCCWKTFCKCAKKNSRLYCPIDDLTLLDSTRHGTTHPLRYVILVNYSNHVLLYFKWQNFPSDPYLQLYFLSLVAEETYLAQNRQLSSMIDISVFVWGTVRLAVRITERSFRSVNSFPAPVAVDALPAAGKPSPSYLHLLVASLLLPPLLFQPPPHTSSTSTATSIFSSLFTFVAPTSSFISLFLFVYPPTNSTF